MKIIFAILAFAISFGAAAYDYRQMPLDEMTQESDLVVVGRFLGIAENRAAMRVVKVLKGDTATSNVQLVLHTGISEMDPVCCRKDATYILFLKLTPRGDLVSSNGRFGVIEIP